MTIDQNEDRQGKDLAGGDEPTAQDEFDAAFDAAADPANDTPEDDEPAAKAPETEEEGDDDDAEGDEPAPEPEGTDDEPEADPHKDLPESIRTRLAQADKLEQDHRALLGRVPGLQRELEDLRKRVQDRDGDSGTSSKDDEGADDALKEFREEYPEVAGPVDRMLQAQQQQIAALTKQLEGVTGVVSQNQAVEEQERLRSMEDGALSEVFDDIAKGGDRATLFAQWYQAQPREIQTMVERQGERITDANEAAKVIRYFLADNPSAAPAPKQTADTPTDTSRRKNKVLMDRAAGVKGKGPGVGEAQTPRDNFDAAWDHAAKQDERRKRQA